MSERLVPATPRWRWRANALAEALAYSNWERQPLKPASVGVAPSSDRARLSGEVPGPKLLAVIVPAVHYVNWHEELYRVSWYDYQTSLAALTEAERGELRLWLQRTNGGALWQVRRRNSHVYVEPTSYWRTNAPLLSGVLVLAGELLRPH